MEIEMEVKTDYSQCGYITAGKVYSIELDLDGDHTIIDDVGEKIWIGIGEGGCPHLRGNNWVVVSDEKPFDITQHEWSDGDIRIFPAPINGDDLTLEANCIKEYIILERKDAIAIAKHFKLTAEDLK